MLDKGYDNNRVYDECRERGVVPIIPLRKGRRAPLSPIPHARTNGKLCTAAAPLSSASSAG